MVWDRVGALGMPGSSLQTSGPSPSPTHTLIREPFLVDAWLHVAQKQGVLEEAARLLSLRVHPEQDSMLSALGLASPGAGALGQMASLTSPSPGQPPHQS